MDDKKIDDNQSSSHCGKHFMSFGMVYPFKQFHDVNHWGGIEQIQRWRHHDLGPSIGPYKYPAMKNQVHLDFHKRQSC